MIVKTFTLFLLLFFVTIGLLAVNTPDKENLYNRTSQAIHNSFLNASKSVQINPNATGLEEIVINLVYKIVDTILYVTEEVTKLSMRLAIENPQINFKLMLNLIFIALLLYCIVPLFKLCVIIFILIKDIRAHYKEKNEIKSLRKKNQKV